MIFAISYHGKVHFYKILVTNNLRTFGIKRIGSSKQGEHLNTIISSLMVHEKRIKYSLPILVVVFHHQFIQIYQHVEEHRTSYNV